MDRRPGGQTDRQTDRHRHDPVFSLLRSPSRIQYANAARFFLAFPLSTVELRNPNPNPHPSNPLGSETGPNPINPPSDPTSRQPSQPNPSRTPLRYEYASNEHEFDPPATTRHIVRHCSSPLEKHPQRRSRSRCGTTPFGLRERSTPLLLRL